MSAPLLWRPVAEKRSLSTPAIASTAAGSIAGQRYDRWWAIFCALVVTQSAYVLENVARIGGGMHLAWTAWAVVGTLLLVRRFPRNPWLWLSAAIAVVDALPFTTSGSLEVALSVLGFTTLSLAFALQLQRTYDAGLVRARLLEEVCLRPADTTLELLALPTEPH
jgi:hypothetical protein